MRGGPVDFETRCCWCGRVNEMATKVGGRGAPKTSDASLCWRCGSWAIFDSKATGGLRKPNATELRLLETDPRSQAMIQHWRIFAGSAGSA